MSEEKNTTPRDTQFAGFAELLADELRGWELSRPDVKQIIARRAYDLACHILYETGYGFDLFNIPDRVKDIPDLAQLPEETK